VLAVHAVAGEAIERARSGGGATVIEAKTYRIGGHSRTDANSYRRKDEEAEWFSRDPIALFEVKLAEKGLLDDAKIQAIADETEERIENCIEQAEAAPDPEPEDVHKYVWTEE
jgi:acetoin:2,6-dichlorophenolindophenol oxidoreductase subunit alpha